MQSALTKVPGVVEAEVTMPDSATVKVQKGKVTDKELIAAVKKAGYSATVKSDKDKDADKSKDKDKDSKKQT